MDFVVDCVSTEQFIEFKQEHKGDFTFIGGSTGGDIFAIMQNGDAYLALVFRPDGSICPVAAGVGKYTPLVNGEPA